jgi:NAD-dependent dihydropyrimidine dehydrogenase PreA subunit
MIFFKIDVTTLWINGYHNMRRFFNWIRGRGSGQKLHNNKQICICPQCGYSKPHTAGSPCRTETCPHCKTPLVRSDRGIFNNPDEIIAENDNKKELSDYLQLKSKKMNLPKVNPDICTGCGVCIENCPMQAIELNNGKAFINAECTNCRLCESECPVGAIN